MGLPEFYNPIKTSVDEIKTSTTTIKGLVEQLQQTDVANLSTKVDSIGIKAYPNRQYHATQLSTPAGNNPVLLNITGKQGIVYFAFLGSSSSFTTTGVKITIDGVVVINPVSAINTAQYQGLIPIMPVGGTGGGLKIVSVDRYVNYDVGVSVIPMGEAILFNDSFKMEYINTSGGSNAIQYMFEVRTK